MGTLTPYVPYDYRRLCDICGVLHMRSSLRRKGSYMICDDHPGERIDEELDRANARQRPFRILPVPNAKPEDQNAPDVFESEESEIFNLLDAARQGGARYVQVASGMPTPLPNAADVLPTNGWAAWHYYGLALATYPRGHQDVWHTQSLAHLRTAADAVLALQTLTGTVATNSYYGGFISAGAGVYYSEDASVCGMALLYAYRLLGDVKYLYGARAAASFLRNLQAIGSDGVHFTSTDAAGLGRLYTGAVTNLVSSSSGFHSDHTFYPSSLIALQFWNELRLTDGDQAIGATTAISGDFSTVPQRLMSACMADMRKFWVNGTFDVATGTVRAGLSATTPAEKFNAYPADKSGVPDPIPGTGSWEYRDGDATSGTTVSGLNFAKGLSATYAVDGLTAQVTSIDDWLQLFKSNSAFETPADTSARDLQRSTTGTYNAAQGIARDLLVRDAANNFAATAKNGGSLYEWGAFGLMSPIWSKRHALGFKLGRVSASLPRRRLSDGLPSDGDWDDRGFMRGRQGLSTQTDFSEVFTHGPTEAATSGPPLSSPPMDNMIFWFRADKGVTANAAGQVSNWADQGPHGWDVQPIASTGGMGPTSVWPVFHTNVINGLPGLLFTADGGGFGSTLLQHVYDSGAVNLPTADGAPVTALALVKFADLNGGTVCTLRLNNPDLEFGMRYIAKWDFQAPLSTGQDGVPVFATPFVDYTNQPLVLDWVYYGASPPEPIVHANGAFIQLVPGHELQAYAGEVGFSIGYCNAAFGSGNSANAMNGYIEEVMLYGGTDLGQLAQSRSYLLGRAGLLTQGIVYDAVSAAQFGLSLRQVPRS